MYGDWDVYLAHAHFYYIYKTRGLLILVISVIHNLVFKHNKKFHVVNYASVIIHECVLCILFKMLFLLFYLAPLYNPATCLDIVADTSGS